MRGPPKLRTAMTDVTTDAPRLIPLATAFRDYLHCSRTTGYRLIKAGRLEVLKLGANSYTTAGALQRLIDSLPRVGAK